MLIRVKNYLLRLYHIIRTSIGTFPAIIAAGLSLLAILFLSLETPELTRYLKEKVGLLIIDNADTARALLSTLIGGVISLTVFSFSMVMILLNQASSNYSPRLLPGLISNKRHQFVLGFYIGAIIFNIICLINVLPGDKPFQIPAFTILLGILLGPVCLGLFVFFIHSISEAIQINNILQRLYQETAQALEEMAENKSTGEPALPPGTTPQEWHVIKAPRYGRLVNVSGSDLVELACKYELVFKVVHPRGMVVMPGEPILYSSKPLEEEQTKEALQCLHFSNQEIIADNFLFGFKQLTEIVVRAMSPGINDPGTAIDALDFLTELLTRRMQLDAYLCLADEDSAPRLYLNIVAFNDLVYFCFSAIRTYVTHDAVLVLKLVESLRQLRHADSCREEYRQVLLQEQQAVWADAQKRIDNPHDLERIKTAIAEDR